MNELLSLVPALFGGFLLGMFFFAGLWWTVAKLSSSKRIALWFIGSFLLRTGVVLLGFYLILDDNWQRLLVSLFGFLIARILVMRLTRPLHQSNSITKKTQHAP